MTSFWAAFKYLIAVYDVFLSSFKNLISLNTSVLKTSSLWRLSEQF